MGMELHYEIQENQVALQRHLLLEKNLLVIHLLH